jgi:hypothetical protein
MKIQIKTALRFYLNSVRVSPYTLLVGMEISAAIMEISMAVPQKNKNRNTM